MAFNLSQYEAADTGKLTIMDARDEDPLLGTDGQPVVFELYGPGSDVYAKADAKIEQLRSSLAMQAAMRGGKTKSDGSAELRQLTWQKWADCTKSISSNFPVRPLDVYSNRKLGYITNQVSRFVESWGNFPAPATKTSATTSD